MKLFLSISFLLFNSLLAISQSTADDAPYKKTREYPPVKLLLPDSSSYFGKDDLDGKKPVLLIMFNPACEHCQHETKELVENIDKFKKIQVVMATSMPFDSMLAFREKFRLAEHENITVGQDTHFFLFTFFKNRNLPFHAFYDKKKKLIAVFEGIVGIGSILEMFKE